MIKERFIERLHERYAERKRAKGSTWEEPTIGSDQVLALVDVLFEELSLDEEDHHEDCRNT
jgi:hypothetical protein